MYAKLIWQTLGDALRLEEDEDDNLAFEHLLHAAGLHGYEGW
jgi:hypothetical protein